MVESGYSYVLLPWGELHPSENPLSLGTPGFAFLLAAKGMEEKMK
jgi:hypothetical protein